MPGKRGEPSHGSLRERVLVPHAGLRQVRSVQEGVPVDRVVAPPPQVVVELRHGSSSILSITASTPEARFADDTRRCPRLVRQLGFGAVVIGRIPEAPSRSSDERRGA